MKLITTSCPESEYSKDFIHGMLDRMEISFHKYGAVKEAYPLKVSAIKSLELRIKKYKEDGNLEHLIDAANYCLAPESRVLTRQLEWIPIGDLKINDELIGFTEDIVIRKTQRKWCESRVLNIKTLILPRYKVSLSNGKELITSGDHKWLACGYQNPKIGGPPTYYMWLKTGEHNREGLRSNSNHFIPRLLPLAFKRNSWESGWIAGILDGEGHLNQNGAKLGTLKVMWAQNLGLINDSIKHTMLKWGYDIYEHLRHNKTGTITSCSSPRGGLKESIRLLMETRPLRLINNLNPNRMGSVRKIGLDKVENVEYIGDGEVVALQTTSKTYIAEGYGHHNCMIEFMCPEKTDAYFKSTDSKDSPGRVWHGGGAANKKTNDKW